MGAAGSCRGGGAENPWMAVLGDPANTPESPGAQALTTLLKSPPPLELLRHSAQQLVKFRGVPPTPGPRPNNRLDRDMFHTQAKIENGHHCLVGFMETRDEERLAATAAWLRSAHEDLHHMRRSWLAGRQSFKLPPRPDDDRPRLLTAEETKLIRQSRPQQQPQAYNWKTRPPTWRGNYQRDRSRSRSQGRGKGKGKGKGRGKSTE